MNSLSKRACFRFSRAGRYGLRLKINLQMTKKLFKTSFNFILFWFSLLGFYLNFPLGVKVQSETSQKDKMAGPAIVNSENVA